MPTYKFKVVMTCGGCSSAVERVLSRTDGVTAHNVDLEKQEVLVTTELPYDTVLERISKTGKKVLSGEEVPAA